MNRTRATVFGFVAILLWSLLAVLTIAAAPVPPFLLTSLTFAIGGLLGLVLGGRSGLAILARVPMSVYLFGTLGLFGYHALYFTAFRLGPAPETGLIAYLWPLLIVLFSGLLPGEKLTLRHVLGAVLAFAGAAVILLSRRQDTAVPVAALGLAFLCAVTWAGYSVLSRRLAAVPTQSVTVYCLATAALSFPLHLAFEPPAWPATIGAWAAVLALGLGPVGLAFFAWDIGVKQGDIQTLGTASYAAPLLSTLVLIAMGHGTASPWLLLAAAMIAGGALLAARAR